MNQQTNRLFRTSSAVKVWSSAELHELRTLAMAGTAIEEMAVRLRRSVSAVRNKAGLQGISLRASGRLNTTPTRQVGVAEQRQTP